MDLIEEGEHVFLDVSSCNGAEWSSKVRDEMFSIRLCENLLPKSSWLLKVGVGMSQWIASHSSTNHGFAPSFAGILNWTISSVWFIVWGAAVVTVGNSCTVSDVRCNSGPVWAVDWNLIVVGSKSMSVSVWV